MPRRRSPSPYAVLGSGWLLLNAALLGLLQPLDAPARPAISAYALRTFVPEHLDLPGRSETEARSLQYRLMTPPRVEPGETYPLVLFLHGSGQRGRDNRRQLRYLPERMARPGFRAQYPCYFAAPQCPENSSWRHEIRALEALLDNLLDRHPIDRRRVYLTGLSMGGFGSWELATDRPDLFAAVVPICGGGDAGRADRLADVPIWAVHGNADEVVPVELSREMIEAIRRAGGNPRYTELDGVGHDSWTAAYAAPEGVVPWMFRQRRPDPEERPRPGD